MHSPYSGSIGSFGLIVVVVTIVVGIALMICLLPVFSESNSESRFVFFSLISTTNDCFEMTFLRLVLGIDYIHLYI
jgi:hypothetical protein